MTLRELTALVLLHRACRDANLRMRVLDLVPDLVLVVDEPAIRSEAQNTVLMDTLHHGGKALRQMLDCIGAASANDHTIAKILVKNEPVLQNLLKFIHERENALCP